MSGHSKWHNIQKTKGAQDAKRAAAFTKIAKELIVAVKEGNENTPKIKALVAALSSQKVADFITATYKGAVVSTVDAPTDGFDASVDYAALAGQTITVAASPAPHAEILHCRSALLGR